LLKIADLGSTQGYIEADTQAVGLAIFRETELLWQEQRDVDSFINVAAIMTFSTACVYLGKDALSREALIVGRQMAERLHLIGLDPKESNRAIYLFRQMSPEWIRATSHIAWGAYAWIWFALPF
jgi:hypothetical protein